MLPSSQPPSTCSNASLPASLVPAASFTLTAWSPKQDLTVADWVGQGRWLGALGRATGWWIGDWVRYGNSRYGERYISASRVTGYDVHSLRNMAYVAGRFEVPRRREALSFSHHAELASLSLEEQELWLDRAEASTLSVRSLRRELREARRHVAARAALAAGRRRDEDVSVVAPSNGSDPNRGLEGPNLADRRSAGSDGQLRASARVTGTSTEQSGAQVEVVCPACGCHFTPTAQGELGRPRELTTSSDAPRLRLATRRR